MGSGVWGNKLTTFRPGGRGLLFTPIHLQPLPRGAAHLVEGADSGQPADRVLCRVPVEGTEVNPRQGGKVGEGEAQEGQRTDAQS